VGASSQQQQQQRACPPIFQQAAAAAPQPEQAAPGAQAKPGMARLGSVPERKGSGDPDWVPSAATLARAASEGTEANQGRCKCGERARVSAGCRILD
jgi:hypothetical protein